MWSLTPDEMASEDEREEHLSFDEKVKKALGEATSWEDLKEDPDFNTPILEPYEDNDDGAFPQAADADEADPDT